MFMLPVIMLLIGVLLLMGIVAPGHARTEPKTQGPLAVVPDGQPDARVLFWLESSMKRVFLKSQLGSMGPIKILAPRNGQVSFQACLQNDQVHPLDVKCTIQGADGLKVKVRRVGYVPVIHGTTDTDKSELESGGCIPGLVPDPLYNEDTATAGPYENAAFWITINVPSDAEPGNRKLTVRWSFQKDTQMAELPVELQISSFTVKPRRDFPVVHWWRGEAIWDWYKTGMHEDERYWAISREYIRNQVEHGSNVIYVPIFFMRRETFKRPCQLLKVTEPSPGKYEFDFSDVSRFVKMARECGAEYFEWSHLWIYWGVENPARIYKWVDGKAVMLWPPDTDGHGELYHSFLKQFLPEFHRFLTKEGILQNSFFHLSDEPGSGQHIINYRKAREFLRQTAPWMKVIDALSSIEYGRQGLTDMPIPIVSAAQPYIDEKIPHWVYFCCGPRGSYLQRLMDTPLPKIRMSGWLFYKLGAKGFLHWGYNYWHAMEQEKLIDPFQTSTNESWPGIPPGDPFLVYPGPDGKPIDSIRWEVFSESLQDYAILQTAGIKPDDPMLSDIKGYGDFPKTQQWIDERLTTVLTAAKP